MTAKTKTKKPPAEVSSYAAYLPPDQRLTRAEWDAIQIRFADESKPREVVYDFLYRPHTLIALTASIGTLIYLAYNHADNVDAVQNYKAGFTVCALFILFLGLMVFPSGPFIRPHPLFWRFVFGCGVLYELWLIVVLFQSKEGARQMMKFFDSSLGKPVVLKEYATDCSFRFDLIWDNFYDLYMFGHFLGWVVKCVMIRDSLICWIISVSWELIEISLVHMLPNFAECWWDQLLLDILISNAAGILLGTRICRYLEAKEYDWRGISVDSRGRCAGGKLKRFAMQFTPESWLRVDWGTMTTLKRFVAIHILIFVLQAEELNHFFLKHLLWIPPKNSLNAVRLAVVTFIGMPAVRQFYIYLVDPNRKRMGTQCYCTLLIFTTEALIAFKFSDGEFTTPMPPHLKRNLTIGCVAYGVFCVCMMAYLFNKQRLKTKSKHH